MLPARTFSLRPLRSLSRLLGAGFLLGLAAAPRAAGAQEARPVTDPNAMYVELLGNGLLYSINYDRRLTDNISARVGVGFLGAASDEGSAAVMGAPIMVNYLTGKGNSHLEAGIGVTLVSGAVEDVEGFEDESFNGTVGTATLGYRYQRPGGGFVFRAGLTPFFSTEGIAPWFGVSFGYGF